MSDELAGVLTLLIVFAAVEVLEGLGKPARERRRRERCKDRVK